MKDKITRTIIYSILGNTTGAVFENVEYEPASRKYDLSSAPLAGLLSFIPHTVNEHVRTGGIVDEGHISLLLLKVLTNDGEFNRDSVINEFRELHDISTRFPFEDSLNNAIFNLIHGGKDMRVNSESYGVLSGILPIALINYLNPDKALSDIKEYIEIFNTNESLYIAAEIYVKTLFAALQGQVVDYTFLYDIEMQCPESRIKHILNELSKFHFLSETDEVIRTIGNGSTVAEVIPLSIWIFLRYLGDADKTYLEAVTAMGSWGGKTDAIGFFTGALIGAYYGKVPEFDKLSSGLELKEDIVELAEDLYLLAVKAKETPVRFKVL